MRELRAWIEVENQMFYQGEQFLDSFLRRANLRAFGHLPDTKTYGLPPLTQFTGLLDIKGNKIFEGDIVSYKENDFAMDGEIVYFENKGCYALKYTYKGKEYKDFLFVFDGNLEIIGNIWKKK